MDKTMERPEADKSAVMSDHDENSAAVPSELDDNILVPSQLKKRPQTAAVEKRVETPDQMVSVSTNDPFFRYKLTKQMCLVMIWICMGMAGEMSGPTLPDLKNRIGVDYEEISRALVGKSAGLMIGSVVGGFMNEKLYQHVDLIMSVNLAVMAAGSYMLPWSTSVPMAATAFAINGFSEGVINTGGNTMVMHLWGEKAASPMNSLHFGFGFGALLAPQIARPFLGSGDDETDDRDDVTPIYTENTTLMSTEDPPPIEDDSRIEIPYSIVGTFILCFSVVVLFLYIKGPPKGFPVRVNNTVFRDMISPGSCTNGHTLYGTGLLICLYFYFIQAVGGERAFGKFLYSFATESDLLSNDDATVLQTAFWASFTTGRLLGIPLAKCVPLNTIIIVDIIGNIITASILSLYGYDDVTVLWVFTCFMGLFISIVFPNGMSWANLRMNMNSVAVMVLMVGGSCGGFIYQYTTGYLFENEGPRTLMYIMLAYGIALAFCYIAMVLTAQLCKPKEVKSGIHEDVEIITVIDTSMTNAEQKQ